MTTKRSYEDQLSMMSDHLCSMNETLTKQREEIDTLKMTSKVSCQVLTVDTGQWSSVGCIQRARSNTLPQINQQAVVLTLGQLERKLQTQSGIFSKIIFLETYMYERAHAVYHCFKVCKFKVYPVKDQNFFFLNLVKIKLFAILSNDIGCL